MTYPTTIKAIIDSAELYKGEPLYMSDIDTEAKATEGAAAAIADYLEKHFADRIYCGHGRDSASLAERLVDDIVCELANEGRFTELDGQTDPRWRHVASQIVSRSAITLHYLHTGKREVYDLDYCEGCASAGDAEDAWSAQGVKL